MLTSKFCVCVNKCPTYSSNSPLRGFCAACAATILALCCAVQCSFVNKCPTYKLEFAFSRLLRSLRCYNSRFMLYCPVFNREQMPNIQLEFAFSRLLRSLRCYNSRFMLCSPMFVRKLACEHADLQTPLSLFVH